MNVLYCFSKAFHDLDFLKKNPFVQCFQSHVFFVRKLPRDHVFCFSRNSGILQPAFCWLLRFACLPNALLSTACVSLSDSPAKILRAYGLRSTSIWKLLFGCNLITTRSISRTSLHSLLCLHMLFVFDGEQYSLYSMSSTVWYNLLFCTLYGTGQRKRRFRNA